MAELIWRFLIGGAMVAAFSFVGSVFTPKSFAGLFGAAPSVALATLALTVSKNGKHYAAIEAHSMIGGAIAFLLYAASASAVLLTRKFSTRKTAIGCMTVWFGSALVLWLVWLR